MEDVAALSAALRACCSLKALDGWLLDGVAQGIVDDCIDEEPGGKRDVDKAVRTAQEFLLGATDEDGADEVAAAVTSFFMDSRGAGHDTERLQEMDTRDERKLSTIEATRAPASDEANGLGVHRHRGGTSEAGGGGGSRSAKTSNENGSKAKARKGKAVVSLQNIDKHLIQHEIQAGKATGVNGANGRNVRVACTCMATTHALIGNCIVCGRIVCEREGAGPCLTCGCPVPSDECSSDETLDAHGFETTTVDEQSALALRNRLLAQQRGVDPATDAPNSSKMRLGNHVFDDQSDYYKLGGGNVMSQTSVPISTMGVRDDQADYSKFSASNWDDIDSNVWLDEDERYMMRRQQEELEAVEEERRNQFVVTFDIEARKVRQHDPFRQPTADIAADGNRHDGGVSAAPSASTSSTFVLSDTAMAEAAREDASDVRIVAKESVGGRHVPTFRDSTNATKASSSARRFRDIVSSSKRTSKTTTLEKLVAAHGGRARRGGEDAPTRTPSRNIVQDDDIFDVDFDDPTMLAGAGVAVQKERNTNSSNAGRKDAGDERRRRDEAAAAKRVEEDVRGRGGGGRTGGGGAGGGGGVGGAGGHVSEHHQPRDRGSSRASEKNGRRSRKPRDLSGLKIASDSHIQSDQNDGWTDVSRRTPRASRLNRLYEEDQRRQQPVSGARSPKRRAGGAPRLPIIVVETLRQQHRGAIISKRGWWPRWERYS